MDLIVVDESLLQYQPSLEVKNKAEELGEPIPTVYIPRKPHSNGLLIYLACTFINHPAKENTVLPLIVDMLPHLRVGDISANNALQLIIYRSIDMYINITFYYRWQLENKPHFLTDSTFCTMDIINYIRN